MSYNFKNQVIILALNENENKDNFSFFVSSVEDVVKPWFLEQTKSFNIFRCTYEGSLILVGTYFRFIVYKHWLKKYQRKELTHIDILLFLLVSIQNLNMLMYMFSTILKITNEASDLEALGYAAGSCFATYTSSSAGLTHFTNTLVVLALLFIEYSSSPVHISLTIAFEKIDYSISYYMVV